MEIDESNVRHGHKKTASEFLAAINVYSEEAKSFQSKLQNELFSTWNETCNVRQYTALSLNRMDELVHMISQEMAICDKNIRNKLNGIKFCERVEHKVLEFTFGEPHSNGCIHYGIVVISKEDDVLNARSCLFKLNFELAKVLVTKRTENSILWIFNWTDTESWYESKSLGFVTKQAINNLCRYKAMQEFRNRNLISSINYVNSLNDI